MKSKEEIAKLLFPDESNVYTAETKNGDLRVWYTNDYPMQHGKGEQVIVPKKIVDYLYTSQSAGQGSEGVRRFTGLCDIHGNEIYAGDIVKYQHSDNSKEYQGEVFYKSDMASFWIKTSDNSGFAMLGQQKIIEIITPNNTEWLEPLPVSPSKPTSEGVIVREMDTNKWYWCKCENCGWEDSSEFCEGGHQIADTGDRSDPLCPVCFSNKIEGEPTLDVPDSYSGIITVNIPLELYIAPYKKCLKIAHDAEDKRHWDSLLSTPPQLREGEVEDGWMKIEDGLPNRAMFVVAYKRNGLVLGLYYNASKQFMYGREVQTSQVTHWQPLPNPPKQ